jgi:hypothetical protein
LGPDPLPEFRRCGAQAEACTGRFQEDGNGPDAI